MQDIYDDFEILTLIDPSRGVDVTPRDEIVIRIPKADIWKIALAVFFLFIYKW